MKGLLCAVIVRAAVARADEKPQTEDQKKRVEELKRQLAEKKAETAKLEAELAKLEPSPLEGKWVVTEVELGGKVLKSDGEQLSLEIRGDKAIRDNSEGGASTCKFVLDTSTDPMQYDEFDAAGKIIYRGICKFDGNDLLICHSRKGGERPKQFSTKGDGSGLIVQRLVRAKKDK